MRYDKKTGHYVPSQHKKLNRMRVRVEVDRVNLTTLWEVLDHAYGKEKVQTAKWTQVQWGTQEQQFAVRELL
jgi:hypothetical protein